ncbi:thiS family protein [Collimonas arenae]|uniref:ThiS family protein n=1 Tax=Collimonas arenae TaxID=279058 RepID=A0A127QFG9_9BURK|nr:MoaD/ThiS family protein [Collimonas arenae]AMO98486.1 thiS family protein [Collimonas arenae]AMP08372.1 thiS family protein [Collimonas arenae]
MATLIFTRQLARFTDVPEIQTDATTLRAGLETAFSVNPRLRSYLLDDQGSLRPNVAIFIDGHTVRDRVHLDVPLGVGSTVHVLQALSGG